MKGRLGIVAWMLVGALALSTCGPATPTKVSLYSNEPVVAGQPPSIKTIVTLIGTPQTAPVGTVRKLHVSAYTQGYLATQFGAAIGISTVNLSVQGVGGIGSVTLDPKAQYTSADLQWMPPTVPNAENVGIQYTVQASGLGFDPATTNICVTYPGVTIDYLQQFGTDSCNPVYASAGPTLPSIADVTARIDHVDCTDVGIVFDVKIHDPDHNAAFIYIQMGSPELTGGGHTDGKLASDSKTLYSFYEEWFTSALGSEFPGGQVTLQWTAKLVSAIKKADGSGYDVKTFSNGPHEVQLTLPICMKYQGNPPVILKPLIPSSLPAAGPTLSAADCPAGTYFAPVTSRCIAIQLPPTSRTGKDSGGECPAGKSYSCTTTGMMVVCGCR